MENPLFELLIFNTSVLMQRVWDIPHDTTPDEVEVQYVHVHYAFDAGRMYTQDALAFSEISLRVSDKFS